jgi:uncharacterized protein (TIGR03435 family)
MSNRILARKVALLTAGIGLALPLHAQTAAAPKFEVASIKPCTADSARRSGRGGSVVSAASLREDCVTVADLIKEAYVEYANGRRGFLASTPTQGGPNWINSERYEIDAKAEGAPGAGTLRGPMLQTLLEDRFHLKIHRESRDIPVYALIVAKGGIKLQPSKEGSCVPFDSAPPAPGTQFCGTPKRGETGLHLIGATMADLCRILSVPEISDRPTIDKTGITGMFDLSLPGPGELRGTPPGSTDSPVPVAADVSSPFESLRAAVLRFGLNLEQTKGPGEILVIDHVERPSGN